MRLGGDDGEGVHRSMAERHAWVAELHAIDAPVSGSSAPALQCTPDGCRAIARRSPRADRGGPRGGGLRRLRRPRHQRLPIVQSRQRPWSSLRIGRRVALKGAQRYRQHALRDARSAVPERREVESAGARGTARVGKRGRCSLAAPRSSYTPATRFARSPDLGRARSRVLAVPPLRAPLARLPAASSPPRRAPRPSRGYEAQSAAVTSR